jgi:hypothetical protein
MSTFRICSRSLAKLTAEERRERHRAAFARICKQRKIDPMTLEPWAKFERMLRRLDRAGIVPAASWVAGAA